MQDIKKYFKKNDGAVHPTPRPHANPNAYWANVCPSKEKASYMASNKNIRFPSSAAKQAYYRNRKKILSRHDTCALCGGLVDKELPAYHPMSAEVDHIIPVSKGGDPSAIENMQLAHRKCNRAKSDKLPETQAQETNKGVEPELWLTWQ